MATFPAYAKVMLEGYSEERDYGVLRTEMDGGLANQRARWTKPIVTRSVIIRVMDKTDKALFDEWMRDDLNGGVGWFDFTDPLDSTVKQARIVGGKLSWSSPGRVWFGECELETVE